VETGRIKEIVEYETIKKESDEYYKGDTYLEQDGVNGVQIFEGTITKVGGVEVRRKESKPTEVLTKKKDKIIIVGTAERPKTAATGTFIKPLEYFTMTSGFGPRWGRHHDGVDLATRSGTPFVASDGGRVVRAGWYGGYGQCIDIDHGNGFVTRYGHCSKMYVSVGDLVYQGQTIGCVGNTGWSTGPHLHFEVHLNGSRRDPEAYVKFF
jgi:murein DD-endopeptidase MepM/ murein hydrolase activator NlpD